MDVNQNLSKNMIFYFIHHVHNDTTICKFNKSQITRISAEDGNISFWLVIQIIRILNNFDNLGLTGIYLAKYFKLVKISRISEIRPH